MDMRLRHLIKKFGTDPHTYDLFSKLQAAHNCRKSNNSEWMNKHEDSMYEMLKEFMPHGSGIDGEWQFDFERSDIITCRNSFHKMDDTGMYDGWIDFTVKIYPNYDVKISGKFGNNQDLTNYLHETIEYSVSQIKTLGMICQILHYHQGTLDDVLSQIQPNPHSDRFELVLPTIGVNYSVQKAVAA